MPRDSSDLFKEIQLMQSMMGKGNSLTQSFDPQRAMMMQLVMERSRGGGERGTSRLGQALSKKIGGPINEAFGGVKNALNAPFDALADWIDPEGAPVPVAMQGVTPRQKPIAPGSIGGWFEQGPAPAHINDRERETLGIPEIDATPFQGEGEDEWITMLTPEEREVLYSLGGSGTENQQTGLIQFDDWSDANESAQGAGSYDEKDSTAGPGGPSDTGGSPWDLDEDVGPDYHAANLRDAMERGDNSMFGEDNFKYGKGPDGWGWNTKDHGPDTRGAWQTVKDYMSGPAREAAANFHSYMQGPNAVFDVFGAMGPPGFNIAMGIGKAMGTAQRNMMSKDEFGVKYDDLDEFQKQTVDGQFAKYQADATEAMDRSNAQGWGGEVPVSYLALRSGAAKPSVGGTIPMAWEPANPLMAAGLARSGLRRRGGSLI